MADDKTAQKDHAERPKLTMQLSELPVWIERTIETMEDPVFAGAYTVADYANGLRNMLNTLAETPQEPPATINSGAIDSELIVGPAPPAAAGAKSLVKPLKVFSDGQWHFDQTGQVFNSAQLDEAAFIVYRDALTKPAAAGVDDAMVDRIAELIAQEMPSESIIHRCVSHAVNRAALAGADRGEDAAGVDWRTFSELTAAARRLLGDDDSPNIGWLGALPSNKDLFQCEHCKAEHLDSSLMEHASDCALVIFREAVKAAEAALAGRDADGWKVVGYMRQSGIDALADCANDDANGYTHVWMRPHESCTIPVYIHAPPADTGEKWTRCSRCSAPMGLERDPHDKKLSTECANCMFKRRADELEAALAAANVEGENNADQ